MLTWILNLIAAIAGILSPNLWVFILIGGSILFGLSGCGWFTLIRVAFLTVLAYFFLSIIAWFLPGWLENIIVLGLIAAWLWTKFG